MDKHKSNQTLLPHIASFFVGIIPMLYFAYNTAFVWTGDPANTVTALIIPWSLLMLYLWLPFGVFLIFLIRKAFHLHVFIGLVALFFFGSWGFGLTLLPLASVLFLGSVSGSIAFVFLYTETMSRLILDTVAFFQEMKRVLFSVFISLFAAIIIDLILRFVPTYEYVAQQAYIHLPNNVSVDLPEFLTVHYFLWFAVCTVFIMQVSRFRAAIKKEDV